jgi:hypothetical protein
MRLSLLLLLLLSGCGSGKGGSGETPGGGNGQGSTTPVVTDCLAKNTSLSSPNFPREVDAVEAFTRAAVTCGANLPALKRQAELMQRNGVTIGGGSQ